MKIIAKIADFKRRNKNRREYNEDIPIIGGISIPSPRVLHITNIEYEVGINIPGNPITHLEIVEANDEWEAIRQVQYRFNHGETITHVKKVFGYEID